MTFTELIEDRGFTVLNEGDLRGQAVDLNLPPMKNFILKASSEENPATLPQKYQDTKNWILSGTPELKRELKRILYAFYFHSIIIMVKNKVDRALIQDFFSSNIDDHHNYHKQDRQKLSRLINQPPINFKQLEMTTFGLKITHLYMNALTSFLSKKGYATFLKIIDESLVIDYVSREKVQYSPDLISEFILPVDAQKENKIDPHLTLATTAIDYANKYLKNVMERPETPTFPDYTLHILDDDEKRDDITLPHPQIHIEEILSTVMNLKQMARLSKNELPSTAYFTFPDHDTAYDINNDGTLISVSTTKGITKLISTDTSIDIDDLPLFKSVTAGNQKTQQGFEFLNQSQIPRMKSQYQTYDRTPSYYVRNLIGPRSFFCKFSPNSQFLMTGGSGFVRLWHTQHTGAFSHFPTPALINWCGDWSPFNHQFAIGSDDTYCTLYSIDRAAMIRVFVGHQKQVLDVKFHPNSYLISTCSSDASIHLWDIMSGKSTRTFADRTEPPSCLQFMRNGQILISGDEAGALTAWDLRADTKLGRCQAHEGAVRDITVSQEGTIIATVGSDREILLWDAETFKTSAFGQAKPLKMLRTSHSDTRRAKFSSRNLLLALGSKIPD